MTLKIPKEQTEFITEIGTGAFLKMFPGQAEDSKTPGSKAYKLEWSGPVSQGSKIVQALCVVAQTFDPENWQRHIYAPYGRLLKLEEFPKRKASDYSYAAGQYVLNFSRVVSLKMLGMKDANLADPVQRARYDQGIAAAAPPVRKFCNPSLPGDLARIYAMNTERQAKGLPPILEAAYFQTLIPVEPHEIWAGCKIRVAGYWYFDDKVHKCPLPSLESVLLVAEGERIVASHNPDDAFGGFAPSSELAPANPALAVAGWMPTPPSKLAGLL